MAGRSDRWRAAGWLLLVAGAVALVFAPTICRHRSLVPADLLHQLLLPFGGTVTNVTVQNHYAMDAVALDYGWAWFWKESVAGGELPLWNPWINGGHPHLAESSPAVFNPFNLLHLVLPTERAFSAAIILQVLAAGLFLWAFLRELHRSRLAATVGALAWALNSAFLMWYWRAPATFAWAPLILLCFERAVSRNSNRAAVAGGLALAVAIVSGSIQAAAQIGFLCVFYFVAAGWRDRRAWRPAAIVVTVGVLASAVQWVPTLELLRHDITWTAARGGQPGWRNIVLGLPFLITFAFPALAGSPSSYDLLKLAGATMGEFTAAIGLVPFTLAIVGAWTARERPARALAWLVVAVLVIVFFTPLVRFTYHRLFVLIAFAGAVLAAYGTDHLKLAPPATVRRVLLSLLTLAGMVAVGLVITQLAWQWRQDALREFAADYILPRARGHTFGHLEHWFTQRIGKFFDHYRLANPVFAVPLLGLVAVAAAWWRRACYRTLGAVIVVATAADLVVAARAVIPQVDLQRYPLFPAHPLLAPVQADRTMFRVDRLGPTHDILWRPNVLQLYGLADRWGLMSLTPANLNSVPIRAGDTFTDVLDTHNVKYIFTDDATTLPAPRFTLVAAAAGTRLYRNETCRPRARFVGDTAAAATVDITAYTPRRVELRVRAPAAGQVVLADVYYPGWRVRVDGRPAPIERVEHCLRAVPVPAGEHVVEFRYAPRSFRWGALLSAAALLGGLVVARIDKPGTAA